MSVPVVPGRSHDRVGRGSALPASRTRARPRCGLAAAAGRVIAVEPGTYHVCGPLRAEENRTSPTVFQGLPPRAAAGRGTSTTARAPACGEPRQTRHGTADRTVPLASGARYADNDGSTAAGGRAAFDAGLPPQARKPRGCRKPRAVEMTAALRWGPRRVRRGTAAARCRKPRAVGRPRAVSRALAESRGRVGESRCRKLRAVSRALAESRRLSEAAGREWRRGPGPGKTEGPYWRITFGSSR